QQPADVARRDAHALHHGNGRRAQLDERLGVQRRRGALRPGAEFAPKRRSAFSVQAKCPMLRPPCGKAGSGDSRALAAFSAWASARHLSASIRRWRAARRWRPCDSQVAVAPAMTPSMAAATITSNSGAATASAALSRDANESKETITSWRLAYANPSRATTMRAEMAILR